MAADQADFVLETIKQMLSDAQLSFPTEPERDQLRPRKIYQYLQKMADNQTISHSTSTRHLIDQLVVLISFLARLHSFYSEEIQILNAEAVSAENNLLESQEQYSELQDANSTLEKSIQRLTRNLNLTTDEADLAETRLLESQKQCLDLQANLNLASVEADLAESRLLESQEQYSELQDTNSTLEKAIQRLTKNLNLTSDEADLAETRLLESQKQCRDLQATLNLASDEADLAETKFLESQAQYSDLQATSQRQYSKLLHANSTLETQLHQAHKDAQELVAAKLEIGDLQAEMAIVRDQNAKLAAQVSELSISCETAVVQQLDTEKDLRMLTATVTSNERLLASQDEQITQLDTRLATYQMERVEWITQRKVVHEVQQRERVKWTKNLESKQRVIEQLEEKIASLEYYEHDVGTHDPSFVPGFPRTSPSTLDTPAMAYVQQPATVPKTQLSSTEMPPVSAPLLGACPPTTHLKGPGHFNALVTTITPATYGASTVLRSSSLPPSGTAPTAEVSEPCSASLLADRPEPNLSLISSVSFTTPHRFSCPPTNGGIPPVLKSKRPSSWTHRVPPPCKRLRSASWENGRPTPSKTKGRGSFRNQGRQRPAPVDRKLGPHLKTCFAVPQTGTAQSLLSGYSDPQFIGLQPEVESTWTQQNATDRERLFPSLTHPLKLVTKKKRGRWKRETPKPDVGPAGTDLRKGNALPPRVTTVHGSTALTNTMVQWMKTLTNAGTPAPKPPDPKHLSNDADVRGPMMADSVGATPAVGNNRGTVSSVVLESKPMRFDKLRGQVTDGSFVGSKGLAASPPTPSWPREEPLLPHAPYGAYLKGNLCTDVTFSLWSRRSSAILELFTHLGRATPTLRWVTQCLPFPLGTKIPTAVLAIGMCSLRVQWGTRELSHVFLEAPSLSKNILLWAYLAALLEITVASTVFCQPVSKSLRMSLSCTDTPMSKMCGELTCPNPSDSRVLHHGNMDTLLLGSTDLSVSKLTSLMVGQVPGELLPLCTCTISTTVLPRSSTSVAPQLPTRSMGGVHLNDCDESSVGICVKPLQTGPLRPLCSR